MQKRRRFKQTAPLKDRLDAWAQEIRVQVEQLPPGAEREALLKKVHQADIASHIDNRAFSPRLQPPT